MTTLVAQYHPLEESYNEALLQAVIEALEGDDRPSELVRLGRGEAIATEALATCRHLIVVAPTWWGAMPAPILAWIQDCLGPWIDGGEDRVTSPLRSVGRLTVVTSHGSSQLINRLQGEPGRQLWQRTILPLCAPGAEFDWVSLYKLDRSTESERQAFIDRVGREIRALPAPETAS